MAIRGFSYSAASAEELLTAGAAKVKITPVVETFKDANRNRRYDPGESFEDLNHNGKWDPVWLAGYQGGRFATGVHDDLWATALALSDGDETILLISLDIIGYLFDEVALVKKDIKSELGIRPSRILISSTHDHSGPDTIGLWGEAGKPGKDPEYMVMLRSLILDCAQDALESQRPVRFSFGSVRYSNPIEDSRPPDVRNDLLLSMRAVDADGETVATVVNYAMHAEVLNGRNRLVTADYPGVLREKLEKKFGGVALFFPADIGGMQSPYVFFHSFWSRGRVGSALAGMVIRSLKKQPMHSITELSLVTEKLLLPIDNPRFRIAIQNGLFGDSDRYITKEGDKIFLPAEIAVLRMGPATFVTVPGEMFPELGNVLRGRMQADYRFLIGLCNNEIGYIVPKEEWKDNGYEESMSLGPETSPILLESYLRLLASR